ncbi:MAG TPA: Stp1/IreP family PP2C-type Ser/Thr phosphatase [Myxococcota bacterium]|nr:Stp1/IreP family PP2C-type Ser/Thr phosphatase [Myxococcota bacterium]
MSEGALTVMEVASLSHVGRVRSSNQDAYGEFANGAGWRALVVADGMGGHQGGEVASRIAVDTIGKVLGESHEEPEQSLRKAFLAANKRILEVASSEPRYAGMGTTGVALLLAAAEDAWVAHVGDSRAYVLRDGELMALTADHSYVAELQRRGFLTPAEAAVHPRRNEVLRSIGGEPDLEVEIRPVAARPGDCFLLCTDGLWGCVPESEMVGALANARPQDAVRMLVDLANHHGGPDNVTVQLVRIPEHAKAAAGIRAGAEADRSVAEKAYARRQSRIRRVAIAASLLAAALVATLLWVFLHFAAASLPSRAVSAPAALPAPQPAKDHP